MKRDPKLRKSGGDVFAMQCLQVLCIQGFLACRKHADRIILLVEMMQGSGCPAFKAGPRCVHNLRKRFHLNLTETQVSIHRFWQQAPMWLLLTVSAQASECLHLAECA